MNLTMSTKQSKKIIKLIAKFTKQLGNEVCNAVKEQHQQFLSEVEFSFNNDNFKTTIIVREVGKKK